MTDTVLITLGRLPKALDLVRGFAELGLRVLVAEPFRWHLCRVSRDVARSYAVTAPAADPEGYLRDLLALIERESVRYVVPVSEEILHVAGLHGRLPPGVRLFAPTRAELLRLHDKLAFNRLARSFGLTAPQSAAPGEALAAQIAATGDYVTKPRFSCSGKGVRVCRAGAPAPAGGVPSLVQRFVAGDVRSTFAWADRGRVIVNAVYRGTILSGTVAVGFERVDAPRIDAWVREFVARSAHTGFISFDFVVDAAGEPQAIECNPRVTSGVHFVDATALAAAMLRPDAGTQVRLREDTLRQQFYPCLTETQRAIFDAGERARRWRHLRTARDVVWSRRDPLPFLTMTFTSAQILRMSIFEGVSLGEAATRDIEWQGGEA